MRRRRSSPRFFPVSKADAYWEVLDKLLSEKGSDMGEDGAISEWNFAVDTAHAIIVVNELQIR